MERKLEDKVEKSFIHEYLTDPDTARTKLNKEMGGIRVGQRSIKLALDEVSNANMIYNKPCIHFD